MTREEAEASTGTFFDPLRFGQLPAGVDYAFVDFAVNSGVGGAIRAVQRLMGFPGHRHHRHEPERRPVLLGLRSRDVKQVIDDICEARLLLMMSSAMAAVQANWSAG